MFRQQWQEFEDNIRMVAGEIREEFFNRMKPSKEKFEGWNQMNPDEQREAFVKWGKEYVEKVKNSSKGEKVKETKDNFFTLLRNLGFNDQLIIETFNQNKKEVLDPLIGEVVAIICLVLGWKQKDKELFSQALGEIGVAGIFAAKPFLCLIAICGLAYGYQENFHAESFKKGGVLGLAGLAAMALTPGGAIGLLAAIVTMLYLNKKIKVDRPVETQLKEILNQIRSGEFFREVRSAWAKFEEFLTSLYNGKYKPRRSLEA